MSSVAVSSLVSTVVLATVGIGLQQTLPTGERSSSGTGATVETPLVGEPDRSETKVDALVGFGSGEPEPEFDSAELQALIAILADESESPEERLSVCRKLARMHGAAKPAVPALLEVLASRKTLVGPDWRGCQDVGSDGSIYGEKPSEPRSDATPEFRFEMGAVSPGQSPLPGRECDRFAGILHMEVVRTLDAIGPTDDERVLSAVVKRLRRLLNSRETAPNLVAPETLSFGSRVRATPVRTPPFSETGRDLYAVRFGAECIRLIGRFDEESEQLEPVLRKFLVESRRDRTLWPIHVAVIDVLAHWNSVDSVPTLRRMVILDGTPVELDAAARRALAKINP